MVIRCCCAVFHCAWSRIYDLKLSAAARLLLALVGKAFSFWWSKVENNLISFDDLTNRAPEVLENQLQFQRQHCFQNICSWLLFVQLENFKSSNWGGDKTRNGHLKPDAICEQWRQVFFVIVIFQRAEADHSFDSGCCCLFRNKQVDELRHFCPSTWLFLRGPWNGSCAWTFSGNKVHFLNGFAAATWTSIFDLRFLFLSILNAQSSPRRKLSKVDSLSVFFHSFGR